MLRNESDARCWVTFPHGVEIGEVDGQMSVEIPNPDPMTLRKLPRAVDFV